LSKEAKKKIQDQALLYHLTDIENLESIFEHGLLSREELDQSDKIGYTDVADQEIIKKRKELGLESHVPFHFFTKNPFDYAAVRGNKDKGFVLIALRRTLAKSRGWTIVTRHPLASSGVEVLSYDEGMQVINWDCMNKRDFDDDDCKSICMAECLSPKPVSASDFLNISVKNVDEQKKVRNLAKSANISVHVNLAPHMLVTVKEDD
tara:strand:+ start:1554 stop:2171 length:618 start_codon:yes stop_codon:yes gene_type:complete